MKLRRVELFASNELDVLEDQINAWLEVNPDYHVIDMRFSGNGIGAAIEIEPSFEIVYTAVIFYERIV